MQLDVGFLQFSHGNSDLLLHRRKTLRCRARFDGGDLDGPLELRDALRVTTALSFEHRLRFGELPLELFHGSGMLFVDLPRQLLELLHRFFSCAPLSESREGEREQIDGRTELVREPLPRSEEHTSELQSPCNLVCRLLLENTKR